jgi:hypothetical protein
VAAAQKPLAQQNTTQLLRQRQRMVKPQARISNPQVVVM